MATKFIHCKCRMATKFIRRFCSETKKIKDEAVKNLDKEAKSSTGQAPPRIKKINVTLQGADCRAAFIAALLLKQHPLIKKIYMYDPNLNTGVARDLNNIDSSAKVEAYSGDHIAYSMRAADIAVLIDTDAHEPTMEKKFEASYFRVKKFAETCNLHCPKAIIVVCVEPVCCMTSLVQSVLEEFPFYHPSRLLGNTFSLQAQINSVVGRNLNLDPTSVHVPLLGGPDVETVVPLISLMTPDPGLSPRDQMTFYDLVHKQIIRGAADLAMRKSPMNDGYAIGKMIITIAKGLNRHSDALANVLARSSQAFPLKYLVSTVRFGPGGIYHNYGIPKLTSFELQKFEKSMLLLQQRDFYMKETHDQINRAFLKCTTRS